MLVPMKFKGFVAAIRFPALFTNKKLRRLMDFFVLNKASTMLKQHAAFFTHELVLKICK
jgi:hypothetical protein